MTIKRKHIATGRLILIAIALSAIAIVFFAPAQALAQSDGASAADTESVSLLQTFFIQRNPRTGQVEILGSLIVWLLLAMSVASIAMIGVFTRENKREVILPGSLVVEVTAAVRNHGHSSHLRIASDDSSHLGTILRAALCEREFGQDAMRRAFERACEEDTAERLRRVETLNIIGSVAPMIGLFGTVYGMILAFSEIVASGGSPDPVGLAAGIGTALTTTFWGLVVAIPALAGYAFIRNNIDAVTSEASLLVDDFINQMRDGDNNADETDGA
jgi:biopolymer transport protein ExbB